MKMFVVAIADDIARGRQAPARAEVPPAR